MRKYDTDLQIKNNGEITVVVTKTTDNDRTEVFEVPMEKIERYFRKLEPIFVGDEFEPVEDGVDKGNLVVVNTNSKECYYLMDSHGEVHHLSAADLAQRYKPTGTCYTALAEILNGLKSDSELLKDISVANYKKWAMEEDDE